MIKDIIDNWVLLGGTSLVSAFTSHFFTRKLKKSEATRSELDNLRKSIDIYKVIIDDLKKEHAELKEEMMKMKFDFEQKLIQARTNKD